MMPQVNRRGLLFLLLPLALAACSLPERPLLVPVSNPPALRPTSPQQVKGLEQAIAAIMTVCAEDLGLPRVEPFYLQLYKDPNAYSYYTDDFARIREDNIRLTLAVAHENELHVNMESARGQSWGMLLRLLAHDYGHNLEYVLIGGKQPRSLWLKEGFADWVAAKVMDALGWESYESSLSRAERELSRYETSPPRLSDLESVVGWLRVLDRPKGRAATYNLAFLAVHKLIAKKGAAGIMDYFQSDNFPQSFGLTKNSFEREMQQAFTQWVATHRPQRDRLQARSPEWKAGYQWQYLFSAAGVKGIVLNEVAREELFEKIPAYVLAIGRNEYPHAKGTLGVLATLSGGKTVIKNDPPSLPLTWPLEAGKQWRNSYAVESPEQKRVQNIDTEVVVAAVEEITVPAGKFAAFRIETYAAQTGELISEQWYAPEVRWFAKTKIYREEGPIEQDLLRFKLD
ncbi:MAG TPA: hypothetical protein VGL11_17150 [Candidatus Binatia bacterium]